MIDGALGSKFWDESGTTWIDFTSQLVNMNLGHQHPKMIQAIKDQAERLCMVAPSFANAQRSEAGRLIVEKANLGRTAPRRPDRPLPEGVLHQRRRRSRRERDPAGEGIHRPAEGALGLPQLSRRHCRGDRAHRRGPPPRQRAVDPRPRQVLGTVRLPVGVPCRLRCAGMRTGAAAPARHGHFRRREQDRRDHPRIGRRHQRHPGTAATATSKGCARCATSSGSS